RSCRRGKGAAGAPRRVDRFSQLSYRGGSTAVWAVAFTATEPAERLGRSGRCCLEETTMLLRSLCAALVLAAVLALTGCCADGCCKPRGCCRPFTPAATPCCPSSP